MASSGGKSLAVGHIPGFQIDPTLERLNMKVYVEPIGGLCNRMRVIASAYQLIRP